MFWKRKKIIRHTPLGLMSDIPVPPRNEYQNMLELLKDSEKYDSSGEKELSINLLETLSTYIGRYIVKQTKSNV